MMTSPPPKKKQKQEFNYIDKAYIVRNLIAARERHYKENRHLYLCALKECSKINDISEVTLLNWMKPSRRKHIYQKAEELLAVGNEMMSSELSLDISKNGNGDIKMIPQCSLSQISSFGDETLVKNDDKSSR
jgi:hypothetical protein